MPNYYPVMLDVRGRLTVVVGGDRVAAEKAAGLVASGAHVNVIHPDFCAELQELAQNHPQQVTLAHKYYEPGDLNGAMVVIVVATDPETVDAVTAEARRRDQLLNVVDVPARCTFIMPSILRRDQLTIAVSTEGASPGLAKRIRQSLEEQFPGAYGPYLRLAAAARGRLREQGVSYARRDEFFREFFDAPILTLLVAGNEARAVELIDELLQQYGVAAPVAVSGRHHD